MNSKLVFVAFRPVAAGAQSVKIGELTATRCSRPFSNPTRKAWRPPWRRSTLGRGERRKLQLVTRDDGGTPGDAVRVAEELIAREVNVLKGTFASNVGLAVANLAHQRKMLFVASEPLTDKIVQTATATPSGAAVHLHADRDARARSGQAGKAALGHRASEL